MAVFRPWLELAASTPRALLGWVGLGCVACGALAFVATGAVQGVLLNTAAALLGVLITVFIVERIIDQLDEQKYREVDQAIAGLITFAAVNTLAGLDRAHPARPRGASLGMGVDADGSVAINERYVQFMKEQFLDETNNRTYWRSLTASQRNAIAKQFHADYTEFDRLARNYGLRMKPETEKTIMDVSLDLQMTAMYLRLSDRDAKAEAGLAMLAAASSALVRNCLNLARDHWSVGRHPYAQPGDHPLARRGAWARRARRRPAGPRGRSEAKPPRDARRRPAAAKESRHGVKPTPPLTSPQ